MRTSKDRVLELVKKAGILRARDLDREFLPRVYLQRLETERQDDAARNRQRKLFLGTVKDAPKNLTLKQVVRRSADLCWSLTMAAAVNFEIIGLTGKETWPPGGPWKKEPNSRKT